MKRTPYCDECKHHADMTEDEATWKKPCVLGHKPRFYMPQTISQAHSSNWGWKRRCEDFQPLDETSR